MSHIDETMQKFKDAVNTAVPVLKEVKDIKSNVSKHVNACIKYGFDRKSAEFNHAVKLLHDFENQIDVNETQIYKMIKTLQLTMEYFDALGKTKIIDNIMHTVGINLSLVNPASCTLGLCETKDTAKAQDNYAALFSQQIPSNKLEVLTNLMNLSIDTRGEVIDKLEEIKVELASPIVDTGISVSTFVKGVTLKERAEYKNDVKDKIHSFTENVLLQSEALNSLDIK